MKVIELLKEYKNLFEREKIETSLLDCKILIGKVLGIEVNELILFFQRELTDKEENDFKILAQRRLSHEPVAKIVNKKSFWNFDFYTNNDVLDPRPDTEIMIESILEDYNTDKNLNILDLGCGSGCIILTLLKLFENSSGVAVDISEKSLAITRKNAENLGIDRIKIKKSNWSDEIFKQFDVIVSNPPYIATKAIDDLTDDVKNFDPILALDGGNDGLDYYKYIAKTIKKNCKINTKLYFEVGDNQAKAVEEIFLLEGFKKNRIKKDLSGIERILVFDNI